MSPSKLINDRNLKCLGKEGKKGVTAPYVLSMRSYAHTQAKHAKRDFLSKHVILPL